MSEPNRFVLLVNENCGYDVRMKNPYAIETDLSAEQLREALVAYLAQQKQGKARGEYRSECVLPGTDLRFHADDLGDWKFEPTFEVLTVDEWFGRWANKRIND